jgi:hypothetical protein
MIAALLTVTRGTMWAIIGIAIMIISSFRLTIIAMMGVVTRMLNLVLRTLTR